MSNWGLARIGAVSAPPTTPVSVVAGNGSAGAWTEVISSIPAGVVGVHLVRTGASSTQCAADVAIGESGSQVLVADRCLFPPSAGELISVLYLPVALPAGQRMWVRLHGLGSGPTLGIIPQFSLAGGLWPIPGGRISAHGLDSSYIGTTLTSATTQHAYGASVEMIASLAAPTRYVGVTFVGSGNGVVHRGTVRLVTASGVPLSQVIPASATSAGGTSALPGLAFVPATIPAGTAVHLQMANQNSASETQRAFVLYTVH